MGFHNIEQILEMHYHDYMEQYEIRMTVNTEASEERLHIALSSLGASGKVQIKHLGIRRLRPPGRPEEIKQEVIEFLKTQNKPRSALQIAKKIDRPQTSLYRILNALTAEGLVKKQFDARWRTNRFSWRDK